MQSHTTLLKTRRTGGVLTVFAVFLLLAIVVGLVLGGRFLRPPEQVIACLRLQPLTGETETQYKTQQATQIALFKSHFLLNSALSRSEISQLDAVVIREDPIEWLSESLEVAFPDEGEIMEITLRGKNSEVSDLLKIVDAIVESYTYEVVHKERTHASEVRESESKIIKQLVKEVVQKLERYSTLQKEIAPEEGEVVATLVLLEDEIEVMRELLKRKQLELQRQELEEKTPFDRVRVLQMATPVRQ